jgi:hypothetical protein
MLDLNALATLPAGIVVSTHRGLYRHVAILTEPRPGQERRVLSLNPEAQRVEEPLSVFGGGQPVMFHAPPADTPAWIVLARARSGLHPRYSWTEFNCEHFVCFAFGVPLKSPQLQRIAAIAALMTASFLLLQAGR